MTSERSAAFFRPRPRRRTVCVYCGQRITGVDDRGNTKHPARDRARRIAARLTCPDHRKLPELDPAYESLFA